MLLDALRGLTSRLGQYAGYSGELFRYSTLSMEWTMLDADAGATGTSPSGRQSHAMTAVGSDIYVFGGYIGSGYTGERYVDPSNRVERGWVVWGPLRSQI